MLVSCLAAFVIPFELFLFSYAVLGPLHYLTEIGWLHQRNYFVQGRFDFLWLILLTVITTLGYLGFQSFATLSDFAPFIAIFSAMVFVIVRDWYLKLIAVLFAFMAASFLNDTTFYLVFFLIFLPTILHVFLFTGSFILIGALKSRSTSGIISLIVFLACAVSFFVIVPESGLARIDDYVRDSYSDFSILNRYLLKLTGLAADASSNTEAVFHSTGGLMIMRFIAFSYTYHYLNWFSKTSVIKWHKVNKMYLAGTVIIWLLSLGIYAFDYSTGLKFLFFLSFLHVFLEFPLNCRTFIEIGKELRYRTAGILKGSA